MTQDQYGQARGAGYGVGGDVVEGETDEYPADESKPMTRFQKVASALRGDRPDRDEADEGPDMANSPDLTNSPDVVDSPSTVAGTGASEARQDNYWEVPNEREDQGSAVTSPDIPATDPDLPVADANVDPLDQQDATRPGTADGLDPARTEPDTYGTSPDGGYAIPEDTVAGHPVAGDTFAGDTVAGDTFAGDSMAGDSMAGDSMAGDRAGAATISDEPVMPLDDAVTEASGSAGRHAAAPEELHPGEAKGTLDDLGDLAYGKLIPDAADFTEQWRQIQFRFVDDPQASVTEAAEVVAQVTAKLEAAIAERQRAIAARQQAIQERQRSLHDRWGEGTQADTETLRETLRMYRAFLDQLIGPKA